MKKILFVMFMLLISAGAFAQETIVSFSGRLNGSAYCQLDSVVFTDLDGHWSETVVYPDSVIVLSVRMGSDVTIAESQGLL